MKGRARQGRCGRAVTVGLAIAAAVAAAGPPAAVAAARGGQSDAALLARAVAAAEAGDTAAAVAAYRAALQRDPGSVVAAEGLASLLSVHGDLDGAVYVIRRTLGRRPREASLHYHLALLLFRQDQGSTAAAAEHLNRARELGFDQPHLYLLLGRVARLEGDATEAVELLRRGLEGVPGDPELLREMGLSLMAVDDPDAAAAAFEQALRNTPNDLGLLADLARAHLDAGRPQRVQEILTRPEIREDATLLYLLARAQRLDGDPAAEATLRRYQALAAQQRQAEAEQALSFTELREGIVAWNEGDVDAGALHFERALEARPGWALARSYLAAARLAQGRGDDAQALAAAILAADPDNSQALMVMGRARLGAEPAAGLELLERAVRLYPYRTVCLLTLAEAYLDLGQTDEAEPLLERAGEIAPDDPWLAALRARLPA